MNDNQFNQGGMGVPPVNNNPQGGVPPVNPMQQPMPQQPMQQPMMNQQPMQQPMPQPIPQQPMMNQPMPQPMPNPMGGQPMMNQGMPQAGFNPGMVPQKKKSPVLFIILGIIGAIVLFLVVWNVVLTKTTTCSDESSGITYEYVIKTRFGKIVKMKRIATIEFDSSDDAQEGYEEVEDTDLCENYGDSGCIQTKSVVGKKITMGVTLTGEALEAGLEMESFEKDDFDLDEFTDYLDSYGYSCK